MKYRDPQTGEFKDITVKASDTLPIGTIVDYDGDNIPNNWELVDNSGTYKKIKKIQTSVGVLGKILNSDSDSQTDTYSCKKIEDKFDEEVGELANLETTDKSNVVNSINEVNDKKLDKEWKLWFSDKKKDDGKLTLPEKFNELYVVVHQKDSATSKGNKYIFNIIYEILTTELEDFIAGGYFTNAVNNGVIVKASQTQIVLADSYANGDYHKTNPNSTYSCWYR